MIKNIIVFLILIISLPIMNAQEIPLKQLETQPTDTFGINSKTILENEIEGIHVDHVALGDEKTQVDKYQEGYRTIYLFMKGSGKVIAADKSYEIVPETIFLPNAIDHIKIETATSETLHYLKITTIN